MGTPAPVAIYSAEDAVLALDQRRVAVGGQCWVLEVLGVHRIGTDLWVQLACKCRPNESLIVRVAAGTTVDDVLHALTWTEPAPKFPRMISVASDRRVSPLILDPALSDSRH